MTNSWFQAGVLRHVLLVVVVAVVTTVSSVRASPLAESVVELSPLGPIADQSRAMLKSGIRDGLLGTGQVEPFVADTIAGIGASAFDPQRMRARLVNDLDDDLQTGELRAVEQWYQSDLGQTIARAETEAAKPEAWRAMQENAPALRKRFDGSRHQELFSRYDGAMRASERAVDAAISAQLSLAEALASLSEAQTTESVRAQILENRPQIEQQVRDQVYQAYLAMYEPLSERELEAYLAFLESPPGQAFTASAANAIHNAIMEPVDALGSQVVRLLGAGRR